MTRPSLMLALLLALTVIAPARADDEKKEDDKRPASVIFLVGDGMGLSQVTLGRLAAHEQGRPYNLDRFEHIGLANTRSANWPVTDSAAAATALASGVKTNNQAIGMDRDGRPVDTIVEVADGAGFRTGIVTTTRITHATPACFVAHEGDRDNEAPIAAQLVAAAQRGYPQVIIGGGLRYITAEHQAALTAAGYQVITEPAKLRPASKLAAILAPSHLPFAIERPAGYPTLAQLTRLAVESLRDSRVVFEAGNQMRLEAVPFFLMVEGGRIDHACHQHDAAAALHDQLDFDAAIGWALDYAETRDDVLVVVTADHATGDLGITENAQLDRLMACKASSELLTNAKVDATNAAAVQAFVAAVKDRTAVDLTADEVARIWAKGDTYWARTVLGHIVSSRYGVEFYDVALQEARHTNTHGHDGAMVPVFAAGRGARRFAGVYENNEIPHKIAHAMRLRMPRVAVPALRGEAPAAAPAPRATQDGAR